MTERQIEMQWRCSSCRHKNRGRDKVCSSCGNPKDDSEQFEMPDDTGAAPTVTDPELLRLATAGRDWQCSYCRSDQRAVDGSCAQCGAGAPKASAPRVEFDGRESAAAAVARRRIFLAVTGVILAIAALVAVNVYVHSRPTTARVTRIAWQYTVAIDRYQPLAGSGFAEARPADAFDVESHGRRHHHDEQVPDGFATQHYSVDVPDGTRTVRYKDRVACGEDCTTLPETCKEKCRSNENGFATCKTVCTGGGQRCTTKYCNEERTKQVPKTRKEDRTRKVQRFRTVSHDAEWFTWKAFGWKRERIITTNGATTDTHWPTDQETAPRDPLPEGWRERIGERTESYAVFLTDDDGAEHEYQPTTLDDFRRFSPEARYEIQLDGPGRVLGVRRVEP